MKKLFNTETLASIGITAVAVVIGIWFYNSVLPSITAKFSKTSA